MLTLQYGCTDSMIREDKQQANSISSHFWQIEDDDSGDETDDCVCNDYELFCCYVCRKMDPKSVEAIKCPLCIKVYAGNRGLRRHCILRHCHRYFRHSPPEYIENDAKYERLCQRERRGQGHKRRSAARTHRAQERARVEAGRPPDGYVLVPTCCLNNEGCQNLVHQCSARTMSGPRMAAGDRRPFQDVQPPDRRSTSDVSRGTSGISEGTSGTPKGTTGYLKGTSYHVKGTSDRCVDNRRTPSDNGVHQVYNGVHQAYNGGQQAYSDGHQTFTAGPRSGLGRPKQGHRVQPEEPHRSAKARLYQDPPVQERSDHSLPRKKVKSDSKQLQNEHVSSSRRTEETSPPAHNNDSRCQHYQSVSQNAEDESPDQSVGRDLRIPYDSMCDYDSDTSSSPDSYTLRRRHSHDSPRKSQRFRVAERDDAEVQTASVSGPRTQAIFLGEATAIEGDDDMDDGWMNLLNYVGSLLFPGNVYAEDLQMAGDYRRPPEATVTTAARTDNVALTIGHGMDVGNNVPSDYPAPVAIRTESRGTSPLPSVETESITVGTEIMSPIELPSEVSLAAIMTAVTNYHGETINQLVTRVLSDRPIELFPDRQRETLKTLVTLAAVNFQAAGRQMHQKLSEAREEWDNLDADTDEFQLLEFQDRVREGSDAYFNNLVNWYIPTPDFHSRRHD